MRNFDVNIKKPSENVFEITTIGNGPHRGESIVIHLGNDEWAIIDSCKMSADRLPLPLVYLEKLEVSYDKVKIVVCTHWHEDHISGLSTILSNCPNATFYIAAIGEYKDFVEYVLNVNQLKTIASDAWTEFKSCLDAIKPRKPRFLFHDQLFFSKDEGRVSMFSLSPSDDMIINFDSILVQIKKEDPNEEQVKKIDANMCSLALAVKYNDLRILICGDLESNRKNNEIVYDCSGECDECKSVGMCNVVKEGLVYNLYRPYDYVQIAHHGSVTGYCHQLWKKDVVKDRTIATTTVYLGSGENLPRKEMLETFMPCVSELYLSSVTAGKQDEDGNGAFLKVKGIKEIPSYKDCPSAIVSRWSPDTGKWENKPFGAALLVNDEVLANYHKYYVEKQA